MNSERQQELIEYLAAAGFQGEDFVEDLKRNIKLDTPSFRLLHDTAYGQEQMFFELYLKKDYQFNAYRLDRYKAIHRQEINIDHKTINGFNTAELEQRMEQVNWKRYFGRPETYGTQLEQVFVQVTLDMLNKLSEKQNFDGIKIQEELMFKYWPAEQVDHLALQYLRYAYERSRDFSPSEYGVCNTHLAYHILSGRLDDLYEKLSTLRLEEYPGIDLHPMLEMELSKNPEQFAITCSCNQPEAFVEFIIPIKLLDNRFELDKYLVVITGYPEIDHGKNNGIDSRELERMMQEVNWKNDQELFIPNEDREPDFTPRVADIQQQLYQLSQDLVGSGIADLLQLKYMADATFFESMINQEAWDLLESLPKKIREFPCEVEAFVACNLLCGRAVQEQFLLEIPEGKTGWVRLDPDENSSNHFQHIDGYSNEDFESTLRLMPLQDTNYYQILDSLKRGGVPQGTLKNGSVLLLEANPENRTINVYTRGKQPIQVNIHYDPDWKPTPNNHDTALQIRWEETKNIDKKPMPFKKHKRRQKGL